MKKSAKKLELRTEVVRALRADEMREAAGGVPGSFITCLPASWTCVPP